MAVIRGDNNDNRLRGTTEADAIFGLAGDDTLLGLGGNDRLDGGTGNDELFGGNGRDILIGGSGNDTLDGGIGDDLMRGGDGDDIYIVNKATDRIRERSTGGIDTVRASTNFTLTNRNLENLELVRQAANGTGNALDNKITGNAIVNTLDGGDGNDTLIGAAGNDTLRGGSGNDTLFGNVDVDEPEATETTDADQMTGGLGDDVYYVNSTTDAVTEVANEGADRVVITDTFDGNSYSIGENVENVELRGSDNTSVTGNALINDITGNDGNNTLNGGAANDFLTGGDGNDQFIYSTGRVFASADIGQDTIRDFNRGRDKIVLSKATFQLSSNLGEGFSVSNEFASVANNTDAATSAALIVFDRQTNTLLYNQNGTQTGLGTGAAFATIADVTDFSSGDFVIVL
jgi:Ca2+-binding RTX toxin-like protein